MRPMNFSQRPPRCCLVNVTSGEAIECRFNPSELVEKVAVNWNRLSVPGLSHQVLQFQSTGNRELCGVEFYLDRTLPGAPNLLNFQAFLRALTVPPAATEGVAQTAPPRCLFLWPGVMTIETVLTSVEFSNQRFAVDGSPLVVTATATFEEILDLRVTSEQRRGPL